MIVVVTIMVSKDAMLLFVDCGDRGCSCHDGWPGRRAGDASTVFFFFFFLLAGATIMILHKCCYMLLFSLLLLLRA